MALPLILGFAFGIQVEPDASTPAVETATLEVSTVPQGARVSVAGGPPVRSPAAFDGLLPGIVPITVEADGALPWRGSELLAVGGDAELRLVAAFGGVVQRVQEEFAPRHVAVQTEVGLYLLPVSSLVFGALAALHAQTRLAVGKPLAFIPTQKVRRESPG